MRYQSFGTSRCYFISEFGNQMESNNNKFRLQLMSDLHIEFLRGETTREITPRAPYLGLLGDIGVLSEKQFSKYKKFLLEQTTKFEKVFVLLGNHEYYGSSVDLVQERVKEACGQHPNLILMQKTSLLVDGVRLLGTTLWSKVPQERIRDVTHGLNDYAQIKVVETTTGKKGI